MAINDEDEDGYEDGLEALRTLVGSFWRIFFFSKNLGFGVKIFDIAMHWCKKITWLPHLMS